ncbi:hypothetical protein COT65_01890 [Candidatus Shapirobacteria bacterium CG09_land_8_20_14_0_10_47_13]|uniref:OmpR/PhoB-type domain-containing protein n=1 Tax=Candidatus Shapirobacteria bacterium CG09_land_8_20_14_0_10_47_13 TaxID=1974481 RepID=A0A2H0WMJ4_9BACT|nr:MAG: hypothetical protein COT65_01890 [Candidatus Shapirobacteria bacterium CG09_land_8_20_14_0_10_47_13]
MTHLLLTLDYNKQQLIATMTININIAKQQAVVKTWLVLQEVQEKVELTNNTDAPLYLPSIPAKAYLKEYKKIFGEDINDEYIFRERAEILSGLERKDIIDFEHEDFPGTISFTTTHLYDDFYKKIRKQYEQIRSVIDERENVLEWKDLKLNLSKGSLQYKNNPPKDVSPSEKEIMFLALLMRAKRIVEYTEIARELKMNCYHPGVTNEDIARNVQYLRRDIVSILIGVGITRNEIKKMIVSIRNRGYKLRTK